jgi:hypothetical protein
MGNADQERTTVPDDFDELLKRPADAAIRLLGEGPRAALRLVAGAFAIYALYGAVAGLFQGGAQMAVAAWKAPVIVLFSLTLCAPSLYVFASLAGADVSMRRLLVALAGFAAMLGLLFVGFLPITWLFSVSSRSLGFVVWLHLAIWLVSLGFAKRFLRRVLAEESSGGAIGLWLAMLFVVSLQVTTMVRPVLWRSPERPLIESERLFFLEHFGQVLDPPAERAGAAKR